MPNKLLAVKSEMLDGARRQQRALMLTRDTRAARAATASRNAAGGLPPTQPPFIAPAAPDVAPEGFSGYVRRLVRAHANLCAIEDAPVVDAARAPASAAGGLGNNTKSQAALEVRDHENYDVIQRLTLDEARREYVAEIDSAGHQKLARQARFSAQSSATKLLAKQETPRDGQWRVTGCARRKVADDVAVLYSPSLDRAHFGNLMICGSVWTCPVCAAKISETRKFEIRSAVDQHCASGGVCYLITNTFSHQRHEAVGQLVKAFGSALTWMRGLRAYKAVMKSIGLIGDIRTLEVKHGEANGWHPHEHILVFVPAKLSRQVERDLKAELFRLWLRACVKFQLGAPNRKHGIDVRHVTSAADYMAKFGREETWGIASEMAKQHSKVGSAKSMTPFDLLRSYEAGNKRHGALFSEFAAAFFGKQQIRWSKGLKAIFGVAVVDDQDIAEHEQAVDARQSGKLNAFEWRVVLHQPFDVRALVLQLAEAGWRDAPLDPFAAVRRYVDGLVRRSELVPF